MNDYTICFIRKNMLKSYRVFPKIIFFNFKIIPIKNAIKMPFIIFGHVRIG